MVVTKLCVNVKFEVYAAVII